MLLHFSLLFRATTVVDQKLLESNVPVKQVGREGDQAGASDFWGWRSAMDEGYGEYLDGDPRPPDQRTPPNTPSPKEEGEPGEGDGDLMQVDEAFHATFTVNEHWPMPRNAKYED